MLSKRGVRPSQRQKFKVILTYLPWGEHLTGKLPITLIRLFPTPNRLSVSLGQASLQESYLYSLEENVLGYKQ